MNPDEPHQQSQLHGDPHGDPLAVVLYRLQQIEARMDRLLTVELYLARHEALEARVKEVEREQDESARMLRQVAVGLVLAIGTALVTAGMTVL